MTMEAGSCASMLQRQHSLNQTSFPEVEADQSIWNSHCFAFSSCAWLLLFLLLGLAVHALGKAETAEVGDSAGGKGQRNPHIDNAKFLGMVLVCWSHLGKLNVKNRLIDLYSMDVIWFHMALFTFFSGSFVRPFSQEFLVKTLVTLVMPLVFFILILYPMSMWMAHGSQASVLFGLDPIFETSTWQVMVGSGPGWYIWYLRCLILWRFVSMFTCQLPKSLQLCLAVTSGCLAMYLPVPSATSRAEDLGFFAANRALCLFPIFVMGQHVDLAPILRAIPGPQTALDPRMFVTWTILLSLIYFESTPSWNRATLGFFDMIETQPVPFLSYPTVASCPADYYFMWARVFSHLAYRVLCGLVFLLFAVPRQKTWFTEAGSKTLYAYLLHFPWIIFINQTLSYLAGQNIWVYFGPSKVIGYWDFIRLAVFLTSYFALLVYGLTSKPIVTLFGPLIEPMWIYKIFPTQPKEVS